MKRNKKTLELKDCIGLLTSVYWSKLNAVLVNYTVSINNTSTPLVVKLWFIYNRCFKCHCVLFSYPESSRFSSAFRVFVTWGTLNHRRCSIARQHTPSVCSMHVLSMSGVYCAVCSIHLRTKQHLKRLLLHTDWHTITCDSSIHYSQSSVQYAVR